MLGRHTGAADPFSQTVDSADGAVLTTTPGHGSREGSREVSRIPPRTRSAESVSTHLESAVQEVSRMAGCPHALAAAAWCGSAACIEGGVLVRQLLPATSTKFRSATSVRTLQHFLSCHTEGIRIWRRQQCKNSFQDLGAKQEVMAPDSGGTYERF